MSPSVYAILSTVFDGRIYPGVAPEGVERPYAVYTVVYDADEQPVNGSAYARRTRMQIDVYADTYADADAKTEESRSALYASDAYPHGWSVIDRYESDPGIFRRIVDFTMRGDR